MKQASGCMRALLLAAALLVLALLSARLLHLEADFPAGITESRAPLSDEGYYASAAVRHARGASWYLEGDFNPAINMPVGQLLHRVLFALFGVSLHTARLLAALCTMASCLLAMRLVGREAGRWAGALAGLLLASHFVTYAYSRVAFMEPVGTSFVLAALVAAPWAGARHARLRTVLAGLLAAAAILVKTSMAVVLPLVAWAAWRSTDEARERKWRVALALVVGGGLAAAWLLLARLLWPADYQYFVALNIAARSISGFVDWLPNVADKLARIAVLGREFVAFCMASALLATALSREFRQSRVAQLLALYALGHLFLLTLVGYGPSRYFAPLAFPLAGLGALGTVALARAAWSHPARRAWAALPWAAALMVVALEAGRIRQDLLQPHYSLLATARGVAEAIARREPGRTPALVSFYADSMALESPVRALNTVYGTQPIGLRLLRAKPDYVLVRELPEYGLEPRRAIRTQGGQLTLVGTWYPLSVDFGSWPMRLYAITWPPRRPEN